MRKLLSIITVMALVLFATLTVVKTASADELKMVGTITKITLSADGTSATAILKDVDSGELVTITIMDELTLDKFKDKRIVEGDEIRTKYEKSGDINKSRLFKKTAGC